MTPCIYGTKSYPEGSRICVSGRGLKCVLGEWQETGVACTESDEVVDADGRGAGGKSSSAVTSPKLDQPKDGSHKASASAKGKN